MKDKVKLLFELVKNNKTDVILVGASIAAFTLAPNVFSGGQTPAETIPNKFDNRVGLEYESTLGSQEQEQLAFSEKNLNGLFQREKQAEVVTTAQTFLGLASYYQQQPQHSCFGKNVTECLGTFSANRISQLQKSAVAGGTAKSVSPANAFVSIREQSYARLLTEGLQLAKALSLPPEQRRPSQKTIIEVNYPVLHSGKSAQVQPGNLAAEYKAHVDREQIAKMSSPEAKAVFEICSSLSPEVAAKTPKCGGAE